MQTTPAPVVRLRPDAWSAWMDRLRFGRVEEQAAHLGVSVSQIYRVLGGDKSPGEQFIAACMAKYDRTFEELFEIAEAS